jgi:hypothetical protein
MKIYQVFIISSGLLIGFAAILLGAEINSIQQLEHAPQVFIVCPDCDMDYIRLSLRYTFGSMCNNIVKSRF